MPRVVLKASALQRLCNYQITDRDVPSSEAFMQGRRDECMVAL